jgi:hypothetical protein
MSGNRWSVAVRELNIFFWLDGKQNRILCTRQRCDGHEIIPPRERSGVAGARRFNIGKKSERGGATIGWSFHHFRDDQWETSYKLLDTLHLYYFPPNESACELDTVTSGSIRLSIFSIPLFLYYWSSKLVPENEDDSLNVRAQCA